MECKKDKPNGLNVSKYYLTVIVYNYEDIRKSSIANLCKLKVLNIQNKMCRTPCEKNGTLYLLM